MINQYDYEVEFRTFNVNGDLVNVHVTYNIEQDWEEAIVSGQQIEKKVFTIERGHVSARLVAPGSRMYTLTEQDLKEWESEIRASITKAMKRQVA